MYENKTHSEEATGRFLNSTFPLPITTMTAVPMVFRIVYVVIVNKVYNLLFCQVL